MLKRIDHVGVVVPELFRAKKFLESLGMILELEREVASRHVRAAFYRVGNGDGARIELIEPTSEDARARRLAAGGKPRIEHIAVEIDAEIATVMEAVRGLGVDFVAAEPTPIDGNLNAFTQPHTSEGIQFQFVEHGAACGRPDATSPTTQSRGTR
jgi:methylmalonyl-CoA/ethylmalonyl-CoA epimerase